MTTSGVTAFALTARDAIQKAMQEAKILALGRDPKASELEDGIFVLNTLLKSWQTRGLSQWAETSGTLTVTGGQSSGTIPAGVREILSASYSLNGIERQLMKMNRDEYNNMPNKAQVGTPIMFHVARQRDAAVAYVWPVPAADTVLSILYERRLDTVTGGTDTIDFPEEYAAALVSNLAVQLGTKYGAELSQELFMRAQQLERAMFDDDRPESYNLGWDCC